MRMNGLVVAGAAAVLAGGIVSCANASASVEKADYTSYVDPLIGSGGHGHVFVGASVPFGMVQLGPTSIPQSWDWCSGYHESDSTVIGFSHTHLSGTGCSDLFDITVMPVVGEVTYARGTTDDPASGLWSYADRSRETVRPGYYSVPLTRYGVLAEMTATQRVGLHRYTFPEGSVPSLVFDLQNGGGDDRTTEAVVRAENDSTLVGYRFSRGWAKDQKVYFVATFSQPFSSFSTEGDGLYGRVDFKSADTPVMVKVALSPTSIEGAWKNLEAELPGWDFDGVARDASQAWNDELSKIRVKSDNEEAKRIFYTGLYHTMISPALFCDVDGSYRGADGNVHPAPGHDTYTVYSLWDTYRTTMPLFTIIQPERYVDMVNNMIDICDEQGRLPVWHLWGCETDCMVGNPGVIPVADAVAKGMKGVDVKRAMDAMVRTTNDSLRGGGLRARYGYIPGDLFHEAIAYDMEYAIADGAVANAAKVVGDEATEEEYTRRSHSYRNYLDTVTGYARGRMSDGSWRTPFDPYRSDHRANDYCEGNAWQYTWLIPHDIDGIISFHGSKEKAVAALDSLFAASDELHGENVSPDISGLIGQYVHGNEPSHHIIYLYTMLGAPDKAADRVRQVLDEMYTTGRDGLSGNEDAGQMSAWYIMSAMGFYPVEPAGARYWFGSPLFDEVEVEVPGGVFTIRAENNSARNRHIKKVTLDGKEYTLPYIAHSDLKAGSVLTFTMGE